MDWNRDRQALKKVWGASRSYGSELGGDKHSGVGRVQSNLAGVLGGLVITLMNTTGALVVLVWRRPLEMLMDAALGFAAGAMPYVISDEIVPETHRKGHERVATFVTMLGVIVMPYLDIALG